MTLQEAINRLEADYASLETELIGFTKEFRESITATNPNGDASIRACVHAVRDDRAALAIAIEAMHMVLQDYPLQGDAAAR